MNPQVKNHALSFEALHAGKVIAYAEAQLGKPYQWGATGPDAFDCSGLAMMVYRAAGITIPRTSQQQWNYGSRIAASQAQPGDLVFFAGSDGTMTAPGHVGIVTGPGTMIDAPRSGEAVREESFSGSTDQWVSPALSLDPPHVWVLNVNFVFSNSLSPKCRLRQLAEKTKGTGTPEMVSLVTEASPSARRAGGAVSADLRAAQVCCVLDSGFPELGVLQVPR
jgi:hypothetical protein